MIEISTTLCSVCESEKEEQRHACVCVRSNTHKRTNVSIQTNKTFESIHTVNKAHEKPSHYLSNLVVVLCLILSVYPSLSLFWCYSFSLSLMHIRRAFDIFSVNRMSLHFQPSRFNIHSQHKVAIFGGSFVLCVRYFSLMLVSHILVASIRSRSHFDWQSCVYAIPSKSRVHFADFFLWLFLFLRCKQVRVFCVVCINIYALRWTNKCAKGTETNKVEL